MRAQPDDAAGQVTRAPGDGRILHATGRGCVRRVVDEDHPAELAARVGTSVRLSAGRGAQPVPFTG